MKTLSTIIIEDEQAGKDSLECLLQAYKSVIQIKGFASNVKTGIQLIQDTNPDLIFMDVMLPDGTGFDILSQVTNRNFELIITSAFDDYALKAFDFSAIDYVLKPISPERLDNSIQRVLHHSDFDELSSKIDVLLENKHKIEKLSLATAEGLHIIKIKDIIRCSSDSCYTTFYTADGRQIMVSKTLKEYSDLLQQHGFIRVHQSHLINIEYAESYYQNESTLLLSNGDRVPVSRRMKKELFVSLSGV